LVVLMQPGEGARGSIRNLVVET